jgi:hypothetical protein
MAYVPDPTDVTQPTDAIFAETAQAEFRALKAYIQSLIPSAGLGGLGTAFRNRLINGDMRLDQRQVGAAYSAPATSVYTADRWQLAISVANKVSAQQLSIANVANFSNNLLMQSASNYVSLAADFFGMIQSVEGVSLWDVDFGLATAKALTLSFWAKASIPGTYYVAYKNSLTRSYVAPFTTTAANTWQFFTILIPGDTAGVWPIDTTLGAQLAFDLGSGTTYEAPATNAWVAGNFYRAAGGQRLVATANATLNITGVQLEVSSVPTPFDRRPLGVELQLAQRYFWKTFSQSIAPAQNLGNNTGELTGTALNAGAINNPVVNFVQFPAVMRSSPSATFYNPNAANVQVRDISAGLDCFATVFVGASVFGGRVQCTGNAGTAYGNLLGVHATFLSEL